MIRFVDLGTQLYLDDERRSFAFYDTVTDRFCEFNGAQVWDGVDDFIKDLASPGEAQGRFLALMPPRWPPDTVTPVDTVHADLAGAWLVAWARCACGGAVLAMPSRTRTDDYAWRCTSPPCEHTSTLTHTGDQEQPAWTVDTRNVE